MTVLVFGRSGQVAHELAAASDEVVSLGRNAADLSIPGAAEAAIGSVGPRVVINAAAWTNVDGAEAAEAEAHRLNAQAPAEIARACAARDIPVVHISTDYVFDGAGGRPFRPDDPTGPLGAYGRTKLAGEAAVREAGPRHVILRTSWVFSPHGRNFARTMLALGATRDRVRVVEDQIGGPTPAVAIARACLIIGHALTNGAPSGTHHFSGAPDTSWAGFARAIFEAARMDMIVEGIPASDWPTPAARPANSRLDCESLRETFGIGRPDWRSGLPALVASVAD